MALDLDDYKPTDDSESPLARARVRTTDPWADASALRDEEIPIKQVAVGDRLRVRPGDGIPVDRVVLEDRSVVDEPMVTGESMPSAKYADGKLIGGTINGTCSLLMRADKVGSETMMSRIVAMVAEA